MTGKLSNLRKRIVSAEKISGSTLSSVERITLEGHDAPLLLKTGYPSAEMYRAEAKGLFRLGLTKTFRIPEVLEVGDSYLLIEWIDSGKPSEGYWIAFAKLLAKMHSFSEQWYGFSSDNYCGLSMQKNTPPLPYHRENAWAHFFTNYRLGHQTHLAMSNRKWNSDLNRMYQSARPVIFKALQEVDEPPSLLHGDLWSTNSFADSHGHPVLIDPAVYYGHRETDLAMMRLFGGYPDQVFNEYETFYPLKPGWHTRLPIYQLYHQLNHLNLFGLAYEKSVLKTISKILEPA